VIFAALDIAYRSMAAGDVPLRALYRSRRLSRLPVDDQKTMCGADVRKRSTKFIVEHCRSDL